MEKYLIRVLFFRFGVARFERDLNSLADRGWRIKEFCVAKAGFFRLVMTAWLTKPVESSWSSSSSSSSSSAEKDQK